MLKFFFADYPGVFLLCLFIAGGLCIYKSQWFYGGLAWLVLFLYAVGVFIFGTTHR